MEHELPLELPTFGIFWPVRAFSEMACWISSLLKTSKVSGSDMPGRDME